MRPPYSRTPRLGRDLPSNYADGEKLFDERVKARFPRGMREADLVADLRNQGFSIDPDNEDCKSATTTRGIVFKTLWSVRWRAKADRIEKVWGVYGVIAP